jgi:rSAM/selenodomain-associated transferase 2
MPSVTVIVPVFRDDEALARTLACGNWAGVDVVVAATAEDLPGLAGLRASHPDVTWLTSARGRARQMNAGAAAARGDWLVFLHADTRLPPGWRQAIDTASADSGVSLGCFRFALDSRAPAARVVEMGARLRVWLLGLPYGDQALFVRRELFEAIGGYADVPIMEDVDLVRRLRSRGRLYCAALPAVTSARRWEEDGWVRRTSRHVRLILLYLLGVPPARLTGSAAPADPGHAAGRHRPL